MFLGKWKGITEVVIKKPFPFVPFKVIQEEAEKFMEISNHPNIITFLGISPDTPAIVLTFAKYGSVESTFNKENNFFDKHFHSEEEKLYRKLVVTFFILLFLFILF